jgi:hypothetical protein
MLRGTGKENETESGEELLASLLFIAGASGSLPLAIEGPGEGPLKASSGG